MKKKTYSMDIDTADQDHIASTAYVKGAYNSAIAAVNKVDSKKQATLTNADNEDISDEVLSTGTELDGGRTDFIGVGVAITTQDDGEFDTIYSGMSEDVGGFDDKLITAGAIIQLVHGAGKSIQDNIYDIAGDMINEQRVEIYTTWENDNAKQQVAFVTAQ